MEGETMNRFVVIFAALALAALVAAPIPAGAFDVESIRIHGYGNWYYGQSDGNAYLSDEDGDYDNAEFALSFAAQPFEKTTVHLQPFWEVTDAGVETTIDIGFGEYAFSDLLRVRAGLSRHPFGIYPEILEVGTLRPFMTLPSGLYSEGAGIVSENYKGVGISGEYFDVDLYIDPLHAPTTSSQFPPGDYKRWINTIPATGTVQVIFDLTLRGKSLTRKLQWGRDAVDEVVVVEQAPRHEPGWQVALELVDGTGYYEILQQPGADNGWTAVLRIDDEHTRFDNRTEIVLWEVPAE